MNTIAVEISRMLFILRMVSLDFCRKHSYFMRIRSTKKNSEFSLTTSHTCQVMLCPYYKLIYPLIAPFLRNIYLVLNQIPNPPSFLFEMADCYENQVCDMRMEKELLFIMKIMSCLLVWENKLSHELLYLVNNWQPFLYAIFGPEPLPKSPANSLLFVRPSATPFCQDWLVVFFFLLFCMKVHFFA